MEFIFNDGGRRKYFKGNAGDCVVRAVAIAEKKDYKEVYDTFSQAQYFGENSHTPRNGVSALKTRRLLESFNYIFIETSSIDINEATFGGLPVYIAEYENHLRAFSHGVAFDTHEKEYELTGIYVKGNSVVKARMILDMLEQKALSNEVEDGYKWDEGFLVLTDKESARIDYSMW